MSKLTTKLSVEMLAMLRPGEIFLTGEIVDSPLGMNITGSGKQLRWVAVRGDMTDWAVYCHHADRPPEWVKEYGDKVSYEENIRRVVSCDNKAFASYRH